MKWTEPSGTSAWVTLIVRRLPNGHVITESCQ